MKLLSNSDELLPNLTSLKGIGRVLPKLIEKYAARSLALQRQEHEPARCQRASAHATPRAAETFFKHFGSNNSSAGAP
jgi:hypothetical protein